MAGFKARVARHPQSRLKSGLALSRKRDGRPAKYPFPDGALNRLARQAEVLFTELAVLLFVFLRSILSCSEVESSIFV